MIKFILLGSLALFLSGILGRTFVNLAYLLMANSIFYYALFKLVDWSQTLSIYYPTIRFWPPHLEWIEFLRSPTLGGFIFNFTVYSTFAVTLWGGMFFNSGYLDEGSRHNFNLFIPQFLVWFSAPAAFISMNWVYYDRLPAWPDIVALCFFAAGTIIRYVFSA